MRNLRLCFFNILCFTVLHSQGQIAGVAEARNYLSAGKYRPALPLLRTATTDPAGKNNAEAWFLFGLANVQQAIDSTAKEPQAGSRAYVALMRALELKPDYGTEINNGLYSAALLAYNEGVAAYRTEPLKAYTKFMAVLSVYNLNEGKRFKNDATFASLASGASDNAAYSAYAAEQYASALPLFLKMTTRDKEYYRVVITIYEKLQRDPETLKWINDARAAFPAETIFRNMEINYYMRAGRSDVLLSKLEEAVRTEPTNPEIQFNLANAYAKIMYPVDGAGAALPEPANYSSLLTKAEQAYRAAVKYNPANADAHYNFGVLYYEKAARLSKQMNGLSMSADDQVKYDLLMAERKVQFNTAVPWFEKAVSILEPRASSLTDAEKITYRNSLIGLKSIYSRTNEKAKEIEVGKKLAAIS